MIKRRYRAPILWAGLGAVVVLAYVLSQPVPIPIDGYRPPETTTAANATAPETTPADTLAAGAPVVADAAGAPAATEAPPALTMPLETLAAAPPAATAAAPAAPPTETLYVSATSLNLRAAPAAGAPVLELLPRGTPVNAVGSVEGWREVINPATGTRGWMSAEYLATTPPAGAAAAPAPAPALAPAPAGAAATPGLVLLP